MDHDYTLHESGATTAATSCSPPATCIPTLSAMQLIARERIANQFKNIFLGGNDQIDQPRHPADLLPILGAVSVMIGKFQGMNDLPFPLVNRLVKFLRIGDPVTVRILL